MDNGRVESFGLTESIIEKYLADDIQLNSFVEYNSSDAPGSTLIRLRRSEIVNESNEIKNSFFIDEQLSVNITFEVLIETNDLALGFNLYNQRDVHIFSSHQPKIVETLKPGIYQTTVTLPKNFLSEGVHYCGVAAMSYNGQFVIHFHDVKKFSFNILDKNTGDTARGIYTGEIPGVIRPILEWESVKSLNKKNN